MSEQDTMRVKVLRDYDHPITDAEGKRTGVAAFLAGMSDDKGEGVTTKREWAEALIAAGAAEQIGAPKRPVTPPAGAAGGAEDKP